MVFKRSQVRNNNTSERARMSDNECDTSFPEVFTREQMTDFDSNDILNRQNIAERNPIDQRFYEMNSQIGELTDLVLALTQQISPNQREGIELNTVSTNANSRSDNVTFLTLCFKTCLILLLRLFTGVVLELVVVVIFTGVDVLATEIFLVQSLDLPDELGVFYSKVLLV